MSSVVGYNGALEFDSTKPDGTMRKLMDVSFMQSLGWKAKSQLLQGMQRAYADYLKHDSIVL
ncbi:MAG: hypothetical protein Q7U42_00010 [Parvibaculum sp.]|nr:hypothetical protein [Parvibaculum sp.]